MEHFQRPKVPGLTRRQVPLQKFKFQRSDQKMPGTPSRSLRSSPARSLRSSSSMMDKENITLRSATVCPSPEITGPQKDKVIFNTALKYFSCLSTYVIFHITAYAQTQSFLRSESSRSNGSRDFALYR